MNTLYLEHPIEYYKQWAFELSAEITADYINRGMMLCAAKEAKRWMPLKEAWAMVREVRNATE